MIVTTDFTTTAVSTFVFAIVPAKHNRLPHTHISTITI